MEYRLELELRQYRQAVVNGLSRTTRQQALRLSRQDDGLTALIGGLNYVGTGLDVIGADLTRLVTSVDSALPSIVEYLAISVREIHDISQMMATPEETRAAERFRNGTLALTKAQQAGSPARTQQWYDLAVRELRKAVEIHEYHPKSWFNLGITLGRLGRTEEAAEAFARSAFFGVDQSLEFGATAVLLAAGLYRQANLRGKSAEILREYLGQLDRCAEIHLALAEHHGASGELQRALELFPPLALDARQAEMEDAEQVAADICGRDDSMYNHLLRLQQAIRGLAGRATALEMQGVSPIPDQVQLPAAGVNALPLASSALLSTKEVAKRLSVEVNDSLRQLEMAAGEAMARLERASEDGARLIEQTQRDSKARISQTRAAGARQIVSRRYNNAGLIEGAQRILESKREAIAKLPTSRRKAIARANRDAASFPDRLRDLEQKVTVELKQIWQSALGIKRARWDGDFDRVYTEDLMIRGCEGRIREYRNEIEKIVRRSEKPWLRSAVTKIRLEEKARRAQLKVAQLNNDILQVQYLIPAGPADSNVPNPWPSELLTFRADLALAQAEADEAAQAIESWDPKNGPELWREQLRQWCTETEQRPAEGLLAAEAQAELALRSAIIQVEANVRESEVDAETAVRNAEAEAETALQNAKDQSAEILRFAERSANAAQARVLQVGGMVSDQLTKLEGVIALIRPPVERVVPFDIQGF